MAQGPRIHFETDYPPLRITACLLLYPPGEAPNNVAGAELLLPLKLLNYFAGGYNILSSLLGVDWRWG